MAIVVAFSLTAPLSSRASNGCSRASITASKDAARPKKGFGQAESGGTRKSGQSDFGVLKEAQKEVTEKRRMRLRIDPEVAARGKVDFVKVESWGTGDAQPEDLDKLRLKSFSPSATSFGTDVPFYEQLVKRIQLLESKGDITIVQPKKLPAFEHWNFGEKHYVQYLVDQDAVHRTLEHAIADNREQNFVALFGKDLGLDRSLAIQQDIDSMQDVSNPVVPTTQTIAYAKYIEQLSSSPSADRRESLLRLIAHIFAVHVSHLSTGMRIGAKAVERIPILTEKGAFAFYRDYPKDVKDPLKLLISAFNRLGMLLDAEEDREEVMQELPKAIQKTSLLLATLAVE